ncbi:MAG: hypothetical protein V2A79_18175 [Planctomycetota bacterium]
MNKQDVKHAMTIRRLVYLVVPLLAICQDAAGSEILKVWYTVYEELHPGQIPGWATQQEVQSWAIQEHERLEPVVLRILRGEQEGTEWTAGLAMARVIPSARICETLLARMREIETRYPEKRIKPASRDEMGLVSIIDVLAQAKYVEASSATIELAVQPEQSRVIMEHCISALQKLGDASSLAPIRGIALRRQDVKLDRLCGLTERIIEARLRGESVLADAQRQLRALVEKYVDAIEKKNYPAYAALMPYGFEKRADENEVRREVFEDPRMLEAVAELKKAVDQSFVVVEDELRAELVYAGRYKLDCILEVDGWKLVGILQVGP